MPEKNVSKTSASVVIIYSNLCDLSLLRTKVVYAFALLKVGKAFFDKLVLILILMLIGHPISFMSSRL